MFRKHISLTLIAATIYTFSVGASSIKAQGLSQAQDSQKVKAKVMLISASENSRVTIMRRNQSELKGCIAQTRDTDFVVTDAKAGALTAVAYDNVEQVKKSKILSLPAKIAIGTGIGTAVVSVIALAFLRSLD